MSTGIAHTDVRMRLWAGAFALLLVLIAFAGSAGTARADVYDPSDWAPSIWSDKDDYGPGELVTLTGAQWVPGESVNIVVNDDAGNTWRRDVDVTADELGRIEDRFNLPDWFVAEYSVRATGATGVVATTSFTDANTVYSTSRVPAGSGALPVTAGSSATFVVGAHKEGPGPLDVTGIAALGDTSSCGAATMLPAAWLTIDQPVPVTLGGGADINIRFRISAPTGVTGTYKALVKFAVNGSAQNPAQAGTGFALCVRVEAPPTQPQTIDFAAPSGVTYGDADVDLAATATSGLPVGYSSSTESVCAIAGGKAHVVAAGTCTITASQGGSSSWDAATPVTRSFTIARAPLAARADDQSKVYGDENPALTGKLTGVRNGDAIAFAGSTEATAASGVGEHVIRAGVTGDELVLANYGEPTLTDGKLTVTKAPLTATAEDKSREYGEANPELTGNLAGVKNDDEIGVGGTTAATVGTNVGEYAIVPTVSAADGVLDNYDVELVDGVLTVTKAPLAARADDQSKVYGDDNPALTGKLTGVKNDDAITVVGETLATRATGVGTYPIVPKLIAEVAVLANYQEPELTDGTLTVTQAPLTANVSDETVEYGEPATFEAEFDGLKNDDEPSVVEGALSCEPAGKVVGGPYAVECSGLSAGNYTIAYDGGSLTVTKAELKVDAQDLTRVYGESAPAPAYELVGFKNGETRDDAGVTGDAECSIEAGSDAGTYDDAITCEPGDLEAANYAFVTGSKGTLTIEKATQDITFAAIGGKKLGDADFDPAATASSGLEVSYSAAPAGVCAIVAGNVRVVGVGTCAVTASQGGDRNHHAAADVSRQFGVTYRFTGFFAPIDMGTNVLNKAKAGSTIPVKFRLDGNQGLGILAAGSPSSVAMPCSAGALVDTIEEVTTATSGLKYDALADQYIYNWKTEAKFAASCRQLVVKLADGESYRAGFTFTK